MNKRPGAISLDNFKKKLTGQQYNICFLGGTEPPFSGKYTDNFEDGMYICVACKKSLFSSKAKFYSDSGWPSFWDVAEKANVKLLEDRSLGMRRTEVKCANCDSHLGHVFGDGLREKGGRRYCINSLALDFKKE